MNILHHKSYHVYNKKNIEKVRKDEAEAERKEKEKQKRIDLAESEVRLNLLRERANAQFIQDKPVVKANHINLFQDAELANNEEHEKEEKEKEEKLNKQVTMYLGGDAKQESPWYAKESSLTEKYKDHHVRKSNRKRRRDPIELKEDPLQYIEHKLGKEEKRKEKIEKKHKKIKSNSIEELRAKRIEREKHERQRTKELYLGSTKEDLVEEPTGYNSQYNKKETLLAKQAKKRFY
ncbi:hypothetical protein G6F56_008244 [Rhizopus delemar]|nr:hypothetical protein G6F56_008244 [Rhizopus delemar]